MLSLLHAWLDEHDIQAYRADKDPEWVTKKADELFSDEITDEGDGELIPYRGEDYTDLSRYSDRQRTERDVTGPATLDTRSPDHEVTFVAFTCELYAE